MKPEALPPIKSLFLEKYIREKRKHFQKKIILALVFFQLLTTVSFITLMRMGTDQVLIEQGQSIIENSVTRVSGNLAASFETYTHDVEYFSGLVKKAGFDMQSMAMRDAFFAALEVKPYFDALYFTEQDDNFFFAQRRLDDHVGDQLTLTRHWPSPTSHAVFNEVTHYTEQGGSLTLPRRETAFRPTQRPWFKAAKAAPDEVVWVGPYVYENELQLEDAPHVIGFSGARTFSDKPQQGRVFAIDVTVDDLSNFVTHNALDDRVADIIFDNNGRLIAAGKSLNIQSETFAKGNDIPLISELNNDLISGVFQCFERHPQRFSNPDGALLSCPNKDQFILAAAAINIVNDTPWYVVSLGEKDVFLNATSSSNRRSQLIAAAITVLAMGMAVAISGRLTQPLLSLHIKAMTDRLTGLLNRRGLESQVTQVLIEGKHHQPSQAVAILDIDHFKKINDNYGHDVGDKVIAHIAMTLQDVMHEQGICARLGGEEFAVMLDTGTFNKAVKAAEAVRVAIEKSVITVGHQEIRCTISIGICPIMHKTQEGWEQALKLADTALYQAKNNGRNRCEAIISEPSVPAPHLRVVA